jgi:hypothetical protein
MFICANATPMHHGPDYHGASITLVSTTISLLPIPAVKRRRGVCAEWKQDMDATPDSNGKQAAF